MQEACRTLLSALIPQSVGGHGGLCGPRFPTYSCIISLYNIMICIIYLILSNIISFIIPPGSVSPAPQLQARTAPPSYFCIVCVFSALILQFTPPCIHTLPPRTLIPLSHFSNCEALFIFGQHICFSHLLIPPPSFLFHPPPQPQVPGLALDSFTYNLMIEMCERGGQWQARAPGSTTLISRQNRFLPRTGLDVLTRSRT